MIGDPFLSALYDRLHDSEVQRRFRQLAPMPIGCVFLQSPDMTERDIRAHFRLMKSLGFNSLKQIMTCPGTTIAEVQHMALDEGIIPWWYGEAGWEAITPHLLEKLRLNPDMPIAQARSHPKMIEHQMAFLRRRIDRPGAVMSPIDSAASPQPYDPVNNANGPVLPGELEKQFVAWLKEKYLTVDNLIDAWNLRHVGIVQGWELFKSWDEVAERWKKVPAAEYRHLRDILRFKADQYLEMVRKNVDRALAVDPGEPQRAGGEMGLFLPFAWRATDMEGIANEMTRVGSFYPSIHLAWHFEEVDFETTRCIYMQSSLAVDWFKGGWSATWESTGGPQQFSGGKGWNATAAAKTAGFTVNEGTMSQLLLSYIAGGFRGVGLWCWNTRTAGWEAGEYALLDRNNQVTARARRAGEIGKAMVKHRDELWQARKEPLVGVFVDWDNEALWAAMSVSNRDKYRHAPVQARIGAARMFINQNVPWEHVTATDLRRGLAGRYRVIYLPAILALATDLFPILKRFVEEDGGRLVVDAPGLWFDTYGRLMSTGVGSDFEKIFGATLDDFQYSSNIPRSLHGRLLEGFVLDLTPSAARIIERFDNGQPAVTEHALGKGTAVLLGFEASLRCFKPGNSDLERQVVVTSLGKHNSPYKCSEAIVYRLAARQADHYFIMNDHPARKVLLQFEEYQYRGCSDAVTGATIEIDAPFEIEGYSGRWIRCER
jgi:beta-galactosidase